MTQQQVLDMLAGNKKPLGSHPILLFLGLTNGLLVGMAIIFFMANEYDNAYFALLGAIWVALALIRVDKK